MSARLNVLAVLREEDSSKSLRAAWSGLNGYVVDIHVGQVGQTARDPDVILVETNARNEGDLEQLQHLRQRQYPGRPVIAASSGLELTDVRKLMRAGVVDVVPRPFTTEEISGALETARQAIDQMAVGRDQDSRVVSYLKGGGGAGATTLATQAACALADSKGSRRGSTAPDGEVCLIDLDVQLGNAGLYLDISSEYDVTSLIGRPERLDATLLSNLTAQHKSGVDVVPAPAVTLPLDTVTTEFVNELVPLLRQTHRTSFVELPAAWTEWTTAVLDASDTVVVVTQFTVPAIRQARRQIESLQREGLDDGRVKVVLNRFTRSWRTRGAVKQAEKALGRSIDFFVPSDFKLVSEAADQGVALREIRRRSAVEKAITKFAHAVGGKTVEARAEPRLVR